MNILTDSAELPYDLGFRLSFFLVLFEKYLFVFPVREEKGYPYTCYFDGVYTYYEIRMTIMRTNKVHQFSGNEIVNTDIYSCR